MHREQKILEGEMRFLSNLKVSAQQITRSAEQGDSLQEEKRVKHTHLTADLSADYIRSSPNSRAKAGQLKHALKI